MDGQELVQRCLYLVERVNRSHGWELSAEQRRRYAERVCTLVGEREMGEPVFTAVLTYYHSEHPLVEALSDPEHPDHGEIWRQVERQIRSLLAAKLFGESQPDGVAALEDFVQEAIADLWVGLRRFRYRSRLQTWVFTVASNSFNRAARARRARKRAGNAEAGSLEALAASVGDTLANRREAPPEERAEGRALGLLLGQILARHPDHRLAAIMQLWAVEERTLREIGGQLDLSVARVHGLLAQAQALLRAHPSLQAWVDAPSEQTTTIGL